MPFDPSPSAGITEVTGSSRSGIFYGWFVVAAGTLLLAICFGISFSFSVYFSSLQAEFAWNRATTSGAFSLYLLLVGLFSTLAGRATDRIGPRPVVLAMGVISGASLILTSRVQTPWQIYVTYSVLLAAGIGASYIVMMSTVARWFYRKRATAMGIMGAGASLGTVVMAPVSAWLIESYQWRTAYMITGIIAWALIIPVALVLKRDPADIGSGPDGNPELSAVTTADAGKKMDVSLYETVRSANFWYLTIVWFWFSFCLYMVVGHIVPRAEDAGLAPLQAAAVMSIFTAVSTVSRLIGGMVADRMDKRKLLAFVISAMAVCMLWLAAASQPWMVYVFAAAFGLFYGGGDTPVIAVVADTFGTARAGTMMGIFMISWGLGSASGPYAAGWIFDQAGSYARAFVLATAGLLVAAVFIRKLKY